jgi:hypothetical protein
MEEYKLISLIAALIITHWLMGYIFYKIGRKIERTLSYHLQTRITDLKIDNGNLQRDLDDAEKKVRYIEEANELMYDEGRKDVIKDTVKEMISVHEQLGFEKIPQKKSLREGGEKNANNPNNNSFVDSRNILLDDIHSS